MFFNRITIFFKSKNEPMVIFANYNPETQNNNQLVELFGKELNSTDSRIRDNEFMTFNIGTHNYMFRKDDILCIHVDVIEQVIPDEEEVSGETE